MKSRNYLSTMEGSKKVMIICLCIILIFGFIGCAVETSGFRVKIVDVAFDTRGAVQDADLYMPSGTSDKSSLPLIIMSHGGGSNKDLMTQYAEEMARRGYAVLNVSCYGAGLSDQPMYDEQGQGIDGFSFGIAGLLDAVNYARTLKFVDQTKIIISGHSLACIRCWFTQEMDGTHYTVNDMMLNFMHDEFGIEFTEAEISQDAQELAEKYLNEDQLQYYAHKYEENLEYYNTRILASVPLGGSGYGSINVANVQVAGYEVPRHLQTNIVAIMGEWEGGMASLCGPSVAETYGIEGDSVPEATWIRVNDGGTANILGSIYDVSVADSPELAKAIQERSVRASVVTPHHTHARDIFSHRAVTEYVYVVQSLCNYNNGPLDGDNKAIPPENIIWFAREYSNTIAMLAMIVFSVAMLAYVSKKPFYADVVIPHTEDEFPVRNKTEKWIYLLFPVVLTFVVSYFMFNRKGAVYQTSVFFPQDKTAPYLFIYTFWVSLGMGVLTAVFAFINKKKHGTTGLKSLGIGIPFKTIMKTLLVATCVFLACYMTLAVCEYLFDQDYRWYLMSFCEMQIIHWAQVLRYLICLSPFYLLINIGVNYLTYDDSTRNPTKDVFLVVFLGVLGVYINHVIQQISLWTTGVSFAGEEICAGVLLFIPICLYIARKSYKITGSVWFGTFFLAYLNAWSWVSSISTTTVYIGKTIGERLLGIIIK